MSEFKGYKNKRDITNLEPGVLVSGSQNVISQDGDTVGPRLGYTIYGAANPALTPIISSYEWKNYLGNEWPIRTFSTKVQFAYSGTWYDLLTGISTADTKFQFAEFWDTTEVQDVLLMVNGESNVKEWSGGVTTFASATVNTITKEGTTTWAESGFYTASTRSVIINGTTYAYTGGEGTTTLTGVTPDPTLAGHAVGSVVYQAVRTTANSAITSLPATQTNDLIGVLNNQVYYGSLTRRDIYVSKQNNYKDCSFSSPRVPGEGSLLTLDATTVAFAPQEEFMYVTSGQDYWYQIVNQLSADLTKETLVVKRLKSETKGAAKSQYAIGYIKNSIVFVSNEPTLDTLGRVEQIATPQSVPLSDPIKTDFDSYDLSNLHVKYFKNNIYIALPAENKLLIYNLSKRFWEAPQVLPVRRLAIIGGELYFHSNAVPETYKLFDGTSDNGKAMEAIAKFSYQNYGDRAWQKRFDEWYTEGYISANTTLTRRLYYDYEGFGQIQSQDIEGDDNSIILTTSSGSLGKLSLGKGNLGGGGSNDFPKFRVIHTMINSDFYEVQVEYSSNDIDQRWSLISFGPDVRESSADNVAIKQ